MSNVRECLSESLFFYYEKRRRRALHGRLLGRLARSKGEATEIRSPFLEPRWWWRGGRCRCYGELELPWSYRTDLGLHEFLDPLSVTFVPPAPDPGLTDSEVQDVLVPIR